MARDNAKGTLAGGSWDALSALPVLELPGSGKFETGPHGNVSVDTHTSLRDELIGSRKE